MSRRPPMFVAVLLLLAFVAGAGLVVAQGQQPQQPTFRGGIIVVPIDVRVIDKKTGKAVPDLKAADFTLTEDGAPQQIRLFEKHAMTPEPIEPGKEPKVQLRQSAFGTSPQNNRIFLIMLGVGRLQEPSKALDNLILFVRSRLLPQDQVAVFAYDRATDFTTDHEAIANLIERFRTAHFAIDMEVSQMVLSGQAALYGSRALPKKTQEKIDNVFLGAGAGTLASKRLGAGDTAGTKAYEADQAKIAEDLRRAEINKVGQDLAKNLGQPGGGLASWTSLDEVTNDRFAGITFDDYMQNTAQTLMDLGNCYAGVEYLRHLEGEKHMVFVSERGMMLQRRDDDEALARAANDARVAIDTFQTGGVQGQRGGAVQNNWAEVFAFQAMRNIAELTGGVSSVAENGDVAVARIDDASRTDYVIGYYPSLARFDGSYRKIEVKVNRPDSTVLYRHGYYAVRDVGAFNRRDFITQGRLERAAYFSRSIDDIRIKLNADLKKQPDGRWQLLIKSSIDPTKLALTVENGEHVGSIDILVVAADQKGQVLAQHYQRAALKFSEEVWQQIAKNKAIPYNASLEINPGVRNVKLIVYDYRADLVGRQDTTVF